MRRFDARMIFGGALVLLGGLLLLEQFNILHGAADLFWGVLFLLGAAYFFRIFLNDPHGQWWAIIPGMVMVGIGGSALLSTVFDWGGAFFLGAIGVAFFAIYATDRARWWGIIPGGVLLTLAAITIVEKSFSSMDTGGLFFLGLGLTFLLVALLPNPFGKTQWAYIPAVVLMVIGALIGSASTTGLAAYIWPAVLILGGGALIFFYFKRE
ncbi:MAG: hypothetical protein WA821_22185 [Anaerolineales bacterium]